MPFLSKNSLNNSIGGYAPYSSTAGILISSTKIHNFLPGSAPKTCLLFFESLASILYCVLLEVV
jgi:hypothetical protein